MAGLVPAIHRVGRVNCSRYFGDDAGFERTARTIRHDIEPDAAHPGSGSRVQGVDGRDTPGHDVKSLGRSRKMLTNG
jgi:hypothetical protein